MTGTQSQQTLAGAKTKAFLNSTCGNAEKARAALSAAGVETEEARADVLRDHMERAVAAGARRILVAGGDGTIASAAALVAGKKTELAILPGGTLNHFAKDHGIPTDLDEAARVAAEGTVEGADLGYVNDTVFLNTSSIGVYVTFVRVRERFEKSFGYTLASFLAFGRMFSSLRTFDVELEVEGAKKSYRTSLVFIGVGERELQLPALGSRIAKGGRRALHVMIVRGRRPARLFAVALAGIARGTKSAASLPQFDSFLVDSCRIDLRRPRAIIALDGELKYMNTPLEYRIERDAIRLVVPAADRSE
ncbi:MAG TPA: diacylglycerol kinase family protein [Gemmatimonadaceae bacterium]|nr:diacylglycerol kinase family protein [Gemmatimonadaceae bacterium]